MTGDSRRFWLADRSTGDLLIMVVATTICFSVICSGAGLLLVTLVYPDRDTSQGFHAISDVVNTLIGLLAGFLAGRTDSHLTAQRNLAEALDDADRTDAQRDHE